MFFLSRCRLLKKHKICATFSEALWFWSHLCLPDVWNQAAKWETGAMKTSVHTWPEPRCVVMFRLRCINPCLRRLLHGATANRDQVLDRLQGCSLEDQVFDVVGKNKAKLTVEHVSCAVKMLWQFQKERPELLRTIDLIRSHPQFLTLRVLAENKISLMDDLMLVDMLYTFLRYINRYSVLMIF